MQTTTLCSVGRVLDDDDVVTLRSAVAELADGGRAVVEEPRPVVGVDPGSRDHVRTVHRADVVGVGLHDPIDDLAGDDALLDEQLLERAGSLLGLAHRSGVVVTVVVLGHAGSR